MIVAAAGAAMRRRHASAKAATANTDIITFCVMWCLKM